jgi:hypothetical protein
MSIQRQSWLIPELTSKIAAIPAAALTAGSEGNLLQKVANGYQKFGNLGEIPEKTIRATELWNAYQNMTVREVTSTYGKDLLDNAIRSVESGIDYVNQVAINFSEQPIETTTAVGIAGLTLYAFGEIFNFIRTKGQGGIITRAKRGLGDKFWLNNKL